MRKRELEALLEAYEYERRKRQMRDDLAEIKNGEGLKHLPLTWGDTCLCCGRKLCNKSGLRRWP